MVATALVNLGDSDVTDVVLQLSESASVSGVIIADSDAALRSISQVQVTLIPVDSLITPICSASSQTDGRFAMDRCAPGQYKVRIKPPAGVYVKSLRNGTAEVKNGSLEIPSGRLELAVVLSAGAGKINGLVEMPPDAVAAGAKPPLAYYVVVPVGGAFDDCRIGRSGTGGRFSVADLPPGRYRVFAIEAPDRTALANPAFQSTMEHLGTVVDVKKDDSLDVTVLLIPANESGRLFSQAL